MTYTAKYKKEGQFFWRSIKKIKGDASNNIVGISHMMFILEDNRCVLVPKDGTIFKFCSNRHKMIEEDMHRESGGVVPKS